MELTTIFLLELRDKYCTILDTLIEADSKLILETEDLEHRGEDINKQKISQEK